MDLQSVNLLSVVVRLGLAVIFGGVLGVERESTRHPAGFRTHMLICVGSALAMLTNEYISQRAPAVDPTRMGAQVISGIGFLGVGTIMSVGRQHVKGLTTAAGLWAAACIGLAIGGGFYAGAVVAWVFIMLILTLMQRMDELIYKYSPNMGLYVEVHGGEMIEELRLRLQSESIKVSSLNMDRANAINEGAIGLSFKLRLPRGADHMEIVGRIAALDGVDLVQEI
jgi:putative Mg2+ transporter-C (MgtC) family protein